VPPFCISTPFAIIDEITSEEYSWHERKACKDRHKFCAQGGAGVNFLLEGLTFSGECNILLNKQYLLIYLERIKTMKPWLGNLYKILLDQFVKKPFSFNQAGELLQVKEKINDNQVRVAFSKLQQYGLITTTPDPRDARKRIYKLNPQNERSEDILPQYLGSPENLAAIFFKAADLLRRRGGERFLPLLFSYLFASEAGEPDDETVRRGGSGPGFAGGKNHPEFVIPPGCRWENIRKDPSRAVDILIRGIKAAAKHDPVIEEAFPVADFLHFAGKPENADIIKQYVELTSPLPLHQVELSNLSESYESILALSALKKGQRGAYTLPRGPVQLLIELLDPKGEDSVYDPCLGLGTTFVVCHQRFRGKHGERQGGRQSYFGQEMDSKNLALARQNLHFNGVTDAQLFSGNPLLHPLQEGERLKAFDVVISCPPWGGEGYPEGLIQKTKFWRERFRYGLPSRKTLDGAWLQIALASTADEGRAGLLLSSGFLSRGGRDEAVREGMVADDVLEAVILLPLKVLPLVGVPGSILVLNKRKHPQRKGKVLFIHPGMEGGRHPEDSGQGGLGEEERRRIEEAYRDFREEAGFSRIVTRDEIQANGVTLIPSVYINSSEKAGRTDVLQVWKSLRERESALQESRVQLEKILRDMGLLKAGKGENP
jgi:type I restriction enzyme M protein